MRLSAGSTRRLAATAGAAFVLTLGPLAASAAGASGHDVHSEPSETQPTATTAPGAVDDGWGSHVHDHHDMAAMTDEEMADHDDMAGMTDEQMADHGGTAVDDPWGVPGHDHGDMADMTDQEMAEHGGTGHDGHESDAEPASRPRGAVLGTFAGVNGAVMLGAGYLRRRDRLMPRHRPRPATSPTTPTTPTTPTGA